MNHTTHLKQVGNVLLGVVLGLLVIAALVLVGIGVRRRHNQEKVPVATTSPVIRTVTPSPTGSLSDGTSNANLQTDLTNVNGTLNQDNQSLQSAGGAVNDGQKQITVPTN